MGQEFPSPQKLQQSPLPRWTVKSLVGLVTQIIDKYQQLDMTLEPLPDYSRNFMPVENLSQWLREDITDRTCSEKKADFMDQVETFQPPLDKDSLAIAEGLWVKTHLEPDEEKLRFST